MVLAPKTGPHSLPPLIKKLCKSATSIKKYFFFPQFKYSPDLYVSLKVLKI